MSIKDEILKIAIKHKKIRTKDVVDKFNVSRQYASRIIKQLVEEGKIVQIGSTRYAVYVIPKYAEILGNNFSKRFKNEDLQEQEILEEVRQRLSFVSKLNENIQSIFDYGFSEMVNNAIEHSETDFIEIEIEKEDNKLIFKVNDVGIGVFRNIMKKKKLKSELEAIQELLKGKTTTQPRAHSGEGIFFTSKVADVFMLDSFNYRLRVDNTIPDVFIEEIKPAKRGTKVSFIIDIKSKRHLSDIFKKYQTDYSNLGFNKTEIKVKLYTMGTIYISRSQARRIMSGLEKFSSVILDFNKVPTIGQAFADEVFRVFRKKHPKTKINPINTNEAVQFMIDRVRVDE